jgi:hypothetical protein
VKKIRAVIRLVRPALGKTSRVVDKDLRDVSRLLAPVADGQGIIATLDALKKRYNRLLPKTLVASLRTRLIDRGSQTDRQAASDHVLQAAAGALKVERRRIKQWQLRTDGFAALSPGLEASFRRARKGDAGGLEPPTGDHYHTVAATREEPLVSTSACSRPLRRPVARRSTPARSARRHSRRVPQPRAAQHVLVSDRWWRRPPSFPACEPSRATNGSCGSRRKRSARGSTARSRTASSGGSNISGGRRQRKRSLRRPVR